MEPIRINITYEYTDRAGRVFRAALGGEAPYALPFSVWPPNASPLQMPAVGDEIEFPSITRVVFTVVKLTRRFRMTGGLQEAPTTTLVLDAPEDAAGPVDSVV